MRAANYEEDRIMKHICPGYFDKKCEAMSKSEENVFLDECFGYDDELQKNDHWVADGETLQSGRNTVTLRGKNGKVSVTDGPYAETKELLGKIRRVRSDRPEPCDSVDVKKPGCEVGNRRDSPG
jgi:hypothetical protein